MTVPAPELDLDALAAGDTEQGSWFTVLVALSANALIAVAKTVSAVVTGSASMLAEAAHSWADTGNEIFLLIAHRRSRRPPDPRHPSGYGREAYVWSMFAAFGLFAAGAAVSVIHGVQELASSEPLRHAVVSYVVLGLAFVLEGTSFLQSLRQARPQADRADRDVLEHVLATSDPMLRAVFAEDAAALVGIVIAATGVGLHQLTGSAVPDAVGSLLVGVVLAITALVLIDRNRRFLVGEAVDPRIRSAALARLLDAPEIVAVTFLHLEYAGPEQVSLLARVDLVADATESEVAARLAAVEARIAERKGITSVVLALAHPGDAPLKP